MRLGEAQVLFVDHQALRHDFPRLRHKTDQAVEAWFLRQGAWLSHPQAIQNKVNTRVAADLQDTQAAWRPPRYGRAAIVRTDDGSGLLDLKGVGVRPGVEPRLAAYGNGLCVLPELLRGVVMNWMIDAIFARAAPDLWTMPVYGILDLGFHVIRPSGRGSAPAALMVRRAHNRPRGGAELPLQGRPIERVKFEIEALLRSYGLTSTNAGTRLTLQGSGQDRQVFYGGARVRGISGEQMDNLWRRLGPAPVSVDGINVQLARGVLRPGKRAHLVDFGHYEYRRRFEHGLASLVRDRLLRCGHVLSPEHSAFVQPDPRLALPRERWEPKKLGAFISGLARSYDEGEIDGQEVRARLEALIQETVAGWP